MFKDKILSEQVAVGLIAFVLFIFLLIFFWPVLTPNISQKIIKISDKIALYPYSKIIQKNTKVIAENNNK